jgi:hypothetical protein
MACWGGAGAGENRARRAMMALTRYYIAEGITITNRNYSPTLLQAKPQILDPESASLLASFIC